MRERARILTRADQRLLLRLLSLDVDLIARILASRVFKGRRKVSVREMKSLTIAFVVLLAHGCVYSYQRYHDYDIITFMDETTCNRYLQSRRLCISYVCLSAYFNHDDCISLYAFQEIIANSFLRRRNFIPFMGYNNISFSSYVRFIRMYTVLFWRMFWLSNKNSMTLLSSLYWQI